MEMIIAAALCLHLLPAPDYQVDEVGNLYDANQTSIVDGEVVGATDHAECFRSNLADKNILTREDEAFDLLYGDASEEVRSIVRDAWDGKSNNGQGNGN